jgi:hypothetical protein
MPMKKSVFGIVLFSVSFAIFLFHWKHQVIKMEEVLVDVMHAINEERRNIHVLEAEWGHLQDPSYLQKMAQKFLPGWKSVASTHIVRLESLAFKHNAISVPEEYIARLSIDLAEEINFD